MVIANESRRRGLELIRAFSRLRNPSLRHLAEATGMAKATTLRYLRTLAEEGYVFLDPETKVYRLTPLVFELGHSALASMGLPKLAEPYMDRLAAKHGVTVNLARLDHVEMVMVARAFTYDKFVPTPVRIEVGERMPVLLTALGRILLAEGAANAEACFALPVLPPTTHTVTDRGQLTAAIQQAARRGYAIAESEMVEGWTSCAISLWRRNDTPYALGITANAAMFTAERIAAEILPELYEMRDLLIPGDQRAQPLGAPPTKTAKTSGGKQQQ
jgi:IclR family pca regulon transcriptional regulator